MAASLLMVTYGIPLAIQKQVMNDISCVITTVLLSLTMPDCFSKRDHTSFQTLFISLSNGLSNLVFNVVYACVSKINGYAFVLQLLFLGSRNSSFFSSSFSHLFFFRGYTRGGCWNEKRKKTFLVTSDRGLSDHVSCRYHRNTSFNEARPLHP